MLWKSIKTFTMEKWLSFSFFFHHTNMQCAKYNEWKSSTMYMKSEPCLQQTRNNWLTCKTYVTIKIQQQTQTKKQGRKEKLTLKKLETWIWKKSKLQAPSPTPTQSKGEGMRGVANWRGANHKQIVTMRCQRG
jgi:hypothetical protein